METFQNINVNLIDKPLYIFLMGSCLKMKFHQNTISCFLLLYAIDFVEFCRMTLDAFEGLQFTHLLGTIYSFFGPFCY